MFSANNFLSRARNVRLSWHNRVDLNLNMLKNNVVERDR